MPRFGRMRRSYGRFRNRAQVIIKRVRTRRKKSFLEKNKTLVGIAVVGVAGYVFKDKIKELIDKRK